VIVFRCCVRDLVLRIRAVISVSISIDPHDRSFRTLTRISVTIRGYVKGSGACVLRGTEPQTSTKSRKAVGFELTGSSDST
jgi:hypothetical protein